MLQDKNPTLIYALLALSTVILLAPMLLIPLSPDNDTYQAMAFAMDQGNGLPYLGSWDQNFPGVVFYHWISIKLFGASDIGFRLVDLANRVIVSLLLLTLAKRFVRPNIALLAIPIVSLVYLTAGYWNMGQRDGLALTWLILALLQVTSLKVGTRQLVIFGASIALASFIRPTNAIFGLLLLPAIVDHRVAWTQATKAIGAFAVTFLFLLMPWIMTAGGVHEFYLATIRFNLDVYGPGRAPLADLLASINWLLWFNVVSLIGLVIFVTRKHQHKRTLLLHAALAVTIIMLMGKYFLYHFEVLLPVTTVLCLVAVDTVSDRLRYAPIIVCIIAIIAFYPRGLVGEFVRRGANEQAVLEIQRNIASQPGYSLQDEQKVSHYLQQTGLKGKTEFFLLFPGLRWRSGDPGMTRFTTTYCMTMTGKYGTTLYQQHWRQETDSMLTTKKPECIVAAKGPEYLFYLSNVSPDSLLHQLSRINAMIAAEYRVDTVIGGFNVYRRNE
jgi:hypothetical protein